MPRKRVSENEIMVSAGAAARRKPAAPRRATRSVTPAGPAPAAAAPAPATAPSQEEIARLAHSYWEARGCQGGTPEEDWLRAERELAAAAIA
jgi:hypothetical protein